MFVAETARAICTNASPCFFLCAMTFFAACAMFIAIFAGLSVYALQFMMMIGSCFMLFLTSLKGVVVCCVCVVVLCFLVS